MLLGLGRPLCSLCSQAAWQLHTCPFEDSRPTRICSKHSLRHCDADRAAKAVRQAAEAGAIGWLDSGMLRSVAFADDDPPQRELYAATAHQLLMLLLDAAAGRCFQLVLFPPSLPSEPQVPVHPSGHGAGWALSVMQV